MFKHILVPTDGSDLSRKAALYAIQFAKAVGAKVTAITIRAPYAVSSLDTIAVLGSQEQYDEESRQVAQRALTQVEMAAEAAGVAIDSAEANHCDLIVMASHGRRGVSALLLGSETQKVLTHSTIPVLVYR